MKKQKVRDLTELPVYEIVIEEDGNQGIRMVSLVENPAIEVMGMYFSDDEINKEVVYQFKEVGDKQIVVGPALIPDRKILRKDDEGNYYYVKFTRETIERLVNKFNEENNNRSINVDHSNRMVDGFIQQNWIVEDPTYDKSRFYGFNNLPIGTWMIEVKIKDSKFWASEVKAEGKYGFSIEGLLGQKLIEMSEVVEVNDLIDDLTEEELTMLLFDKVSFDFDGTLTNRKVLEVAKQKIREGNKVFIVTKRSPDNQVMKVAKELGIPDSRVIFTNHGPKWKYLKRLGIDYHYDNMKDEVDEINSKTDTKAIIV
jgi:hypothetical protein